MAEYNAFSVLNKIDCSEHIEKKNGLSYLSWAWAWQIACENFPDATYTIYEDDIGRFYHTDGKTAWVKTGVTIQGKECVEYLPVMDHRNQSIPMERLTSFDVNKAIQRSLTKALARHGLGLYIYAGEDLPTDAMASVMMAAELKKEPVLCEECREPIVPFNFKGKLISVDEIVKKSQAAYGQSLCIKCGKKHKEEGK